MEGVVVVVAVVFEVKIVEALLFKALIVDAFVEGSVVVGVVVLEASVVDLGKSHNSNWLRYLCQTRPSSSFFEKKSLPKRGNLIFSHFFN